MYILMPNTRLVGLIGLYLLNIVIYDQTFSFNWLSKDDYIFLICQQKITASF